MKSPDTMTREELEDEVAYLRGEMGLIKADRIYMVMKRAFGLTPIATRFLMALSDAAPHWLSEDDFDRLIPPTASQYRGRRNAKVYVSRIRNVIGRNAVDFARGQGWAITPAGAAAVDRALQAAGVMQ